MQEFMRLFIQAAKETPRLYFAPLIGAWKGIRQEYRVIERERSRRWQQQQKD